MKSDYDYNLDHIEITNHIEAMLTAPLDEAREAMAEPIQLLAWAKSATEIQPDPMLYQDLNANPGHPPPKFPTGLREIDNKTDGGGYGFTVIAAAPKCGKSMLALSCAIEAARKGWRVWHLNAELSEYAILNRVKNYLGPEIHTSIIDQIHSYHTERGFGLPMFLEHLEDDLSITDTKWLIVADSVNRIVRQSLAGSSENAYWRNLEKWSDFFRVSSKLSGGRIASVVVSELNARGSSKGGQLEYDGDLVIKGWKQAAEDDEIFLSIPHARSSAGGHLGKFWIDWKNARFVPIDSKPSDEPGEWYDL